MQNLNDLIWINTCKTSPICDTMRVKAIMRPPHKAASNNTFLTIPTSFQRRF